MDWYAVGREFGLVGIISISVLTMFFFILKWVLAQFQVELTANRSERKDYLSVLSDIKRSIEEHNAAAKEFHSCVATEHKEMITTLGRINGYKH